MNLDLLGIAFLTVTLLGFYLAYLYGHKTKRFRWSEYIAILIWPTLFVIALSYYVSIKILVLFIVGAAVGFVLEYIFGFTYYKVLNQRLWQYNRLSING